VPASFEERKRPGLLFLRESLATIPVRLLLLKCGSEVNASVCFHTSLMLRFDETFRITQSKYADVKLGDYKTEQESFFSFRSFENVFDEVNRFHQSILSGLDLRARAHVEDLFKLCEEESHRESAIESFGVLSSLNYEIPKGTYSCLSARWFSDQKQLLDETTDRLGLFIVTEDARKWIKEHQISPVYEAEVNASVAKKAHEEKEKFDREKDALFAHVDFTQPKAKLLKEWSGKLRDAFPHSPVEQWILAYSKERS
jgi:hypothetical protein